MRRSLHRCAASGIVSTRRGTCGRAPGVLIELPGVNIVEAACGGGGSQAQVGHRAPRLVALGKMRTDTRRFCMRALPANASVEQHARRPQMASPSAIVHSVEDVAFGQCHDPSQERKSMSLLVMHTT